MGNIGDWFVDAVALNENLDFGKILVCGLIYMLLFWFAICVWVYNDAKRRYQNSDPRTPLLIATGVFILFFPALVFYLAVRPHPEDLDWGGYGDGGVNVPIVNFKGEKGIEMTLELNIHPSNENVQDKPNDMKIDIEWKADRDDLEKKELEEGERNDAKFWDKFDKFKGELKGKFEDISKKIKRRKNEEKKEDVSGTESEKKGDKKD